MKTGSMARAADERPVYFRVGKDHVFGVLTEPVSRPSGIDVLLLAGGVYVLSTNRNRMFVTLARALAGQGHRVLRIDYRGVGESTGVIGSYSLIDPNVADVQSAVEYLISESTTGLAVLGSCYGARAAMHVLAGHPNLRAAVLLAPPLGDTGRGDVDAANEVGPLFLSRARTLQARKIPTLFVYGERDAYYDHFRSVYPSTLKTLFEEDSSLSVRVLPGELHSLSHVRVQEIFVATALTWFPEALGAESR